MNSVKFLDKLCKETLCFTHYTEWELSSYCKGSFFTHDGLIGHVRGKTIDECTDRAMSAVKEKIYDTV